METKEVTRGELIVAGIGGTGALTIGETVASAATRKYEHVTWFPSYETFQRGGLVECTVVFSNDEIASPILDKSQTVLILESSQVEPFLKRVRPGGLMLVEASNMGEKNKIESKDFTIEYVPVIKLARDMGNIRNSNLIMMGVYLELTGILPFDLVISELERKFASKGGKKAEQALSENKSALDKGITVAREMRKV